MATMAEVIATLLREAEELDRVPLVTQGLLREFEAEGADTWALFWRPFWGLAD